MIAPLRSPRPRSPLAQRAKLGIAAAAVLVAVGAAVAVRQAARARDDAAARAETPSELFGVEFAGCAAVVTGPRCEVTENTTIRLWIPATAHPPLQFGSDLGALEPVSRAVVQEGALVHVPVPSGAREIWVRDARGRTFRLEMAPTRAVAWLDEVHKLREAGKLTEARARVTAEMAAADAARDATGGDARTRAQAVATLARIDLARGELEAAEAELREAIALDHASGLLSNEADDAFALVFLLDQRLFRYADARAVLAATGTAIATYPEGRARHPFYEGLLVADTVDMHGALVKYRDAEQLAERLGMTRLQRLARNSYAHQLAGLGFRGEALEELRALSRTSDESPPCDHAAVLAAIGIWTLRSLDVGANYVTVTAPTPPPAQSPRGPSAPPATPLKPADLREAAAAFSEAAALFPTQCPDVHRHAEALLGQSEVALREGNLDVARERLSAARAAIPSPRSSLALEAFALEARVAMAENRPERALAAYAALTRASGATLLPEWQYATALGRGEALEALGRLPEALAAYEETEALVNDQSLSIPLEEGRSSFLADREKSARVHIDLLLRMGRPAEALARARASRSRAVAAFQRAARLRGLSGTQRERWERSIEVYRRVREVLETQAGDEWKWSSERVAREAAARKKRDAELRAALDAAFSVLAAGAPAGEPPPPQPGELVVTYHPIRVGWAGFGLSESGLETFHVDALPAATSPEDLAARLLAPLGPALERARRLRMLTYGPLRHIDVHALPWRGAPLLDRLAVSYGFDAPAPLPAPAPAPSDAGNDAAGARARKIALVVSDPNSNLPSAQREAREVGLALGRDPGLDVRVLANDAATSQRVRDELRQASLFHYAGHGWFGGRAGLESALALAADGTLTVGDILALPHVPGTVILSGCETARAAEDGAGEGLGLAHAFVAAGAQSVVAPARPVEDALAAEVTIAFYQALATTPDPVDALRAAQQVVRKRSPDADWAAFRIVTP